MAAAILAAMDCGDALAGLDEVATDLPAATLARLLGIHITVAWQRASAGDWAAYAAEVSRRAHPGPDSPALAARPR